MVFQMIKIDIESPIKERTFFRKVLDKYSLLLQNGNLILMVGLSSGLSKNVFGIMLASRSKLKISYDLIYKAHRVTCVGISTFNIL